jgi:hypothetical protein
MEGDFIIDHFFNKDRVDIIVDLIYEIVGKLELEEIKVRFNQNLDLMLLHFNTIPDPIQKGIYEAIERDINIEPMISNLSRMETILKGTEWEKAVKSNIIPKQFDPFAGLDTSSTKDMPATKDLNSLF